MTSGAKLLKALSKGPAALANVLSASTVVLRDLKWMPRLPR